MAKIMVYIDEESQVVRIYGSQNHTVPFNQIHKIKTILNGKTVDYVSEVLEASAQEVIELVSQFVSGEVVVEENPIVPAADGKLWLHATKSGYLNIPDLKIKFNGPFDFKLLNQNGMAYVEQNHILSSMLKKGLIEVINTTEMNRIKRKEADKIQEMEDKKLQSTPIIDMSARDFKPTVGRDVPEMEVDENTSLEEEETQALLRKLGVKNEPKESDEGVEIL